MATSLVKLSTGQIHQIEKDVQQAGINFSHLSSDLVDHICCYVEELMENGKNFEKAYAQVRFEIDFENLKDIQIQTIIVINQKFKTMKTLMKVSGISGFLLFIIGLFMKIGHVEGAGIIFTLAFLCLIVAYLPALTLTVRKEKILGKKLPLFYSGVVAVFFTMITFVFIMMHWPYRVYPLLASWLTMMIFLILYFFHTLKTQENRIINLSILLVLSIVLLSNVYTYSVSTMNPMTEVSVHEYNLDESDEYYAHKNLILLSALDSLNENSLVFNKSVEFIDTTEKILEQARNIRNAFFSDRGQIVKFNKKFFKNYYLSNDMEKQIKDFEKEVLQYKEYVVVIAESKRSSDLIPLMKKSLVFGWRDSNSNPIVTYNNITRLIRDIQMIESELLESIIAKHIQ